MNLFEDESALVRLAKVTRVEGHKRRSKLGNTTHVDSYLRKVLDSFGKGADADTKRAAFVEKHEALKAERGPAFAKQVATRVESENRSAGGSGAPAKKAPAQFGGGQESDSGGSDLSKSVSTPFPKMTKAQAQPVLNGAPEGAVIKDKSMKQSYVKTAKGWQTGDADGKNPSGPVLKNLASTVGKNPKNYSTNIKVGGEENDSPKSAVAPKTGGPSNSEKVSNAEKKFGSETPDTSADTDELADADSPSGGGNSNAPQAPDSSSRSLPEGFHETKDWDGSDIVAMTPEKHSQHLTEVRAKLQVAYDNNLQTDKVHKVAGPDGSMAYTPERQAEHKKIIDDIMADAKRRNVPKDRRAVMSGGLGGAGKSSVLGSGKADVNEGEFIVLNPDEMKDEIIKRGLAPEIEGVQPMETAGLIHEESGDLAMELSEAAQSAGYNVMWDITMGSEGSVSKRLDVLQANGYEVEAVFVDIPVESSVERALARHERGATKRILNGDGPGGRFVDPDIIRLNKPEEGSPWNSKNRAVFESLKDRFGNWQVFDNSGDGGPKKVGEAPPGARSRRSDGFVWVKQNDGTWVRDPNANRNTSLPTTSETASLSRPGPAVERLLRLTQRNKGVTLKAKTKN